MANLAARQLAQTRRELERDLKHKDRGKLRALREDIRTAKRTRKEKLREVAETCRAARRQSIERAKKARERLRESIRRTRERAKGLCVISRGEAQTSTLKQIEKAVGALEQERALQAQLAVWTRPKSCPTPTRARHEKREESDCEVAANIDEPGLRAVWEHVKHKIKGSPRRTRSEEFFEWVAEHQANVYEIQEADAERALRELEAEERRLTKELKKAGEYQRRARKALAAGDVPF